ncbi:hypothetical protein [Moraxella lacunata]
MTNTTIIKTPMSTVEAIEKMALNSGMFMVNPLAFLWIKSICYLYTFFT